MARGAARVIDELVTYAGGVLLAAVLIGAVAGVGVWKLGAWLMGGGNC